MFTKKETLLQNIAFMGIIAAINVLLCALGAYLPITSVFIMIFLPFLSAVVALLCKKKYYVIYAFATIGVALAVTLWHTEFTLFYLIPSIITGFLFGLCLSYKLNGVYSILFTSLIQLGLTYLIIPIIDGIYGTNLIQTFLALFNLTGEEAVTYVMYIVPSFIYLISLVQMTFSYIVLINEIKKFDNYDENPIDLPFSSIGFILSLLVTAFTFFALNLAYLIMFISLYISVAILVNYIDQRKKNLIILTSGFIAIGFILALTLSMVVKKPYTLLLINLSNILVSGFSLYNHIREK